ncbi:malto-oligosyltrehalose synthase [Cryobacterium sp. CG_9.6]|uniref:malto-oligosyltrehalose synthase n=1 Tax=Cryobacterium sp. CG_9.6 TaxID=2760710 RepID=UPI002473D4F8|nr:malto-oligosyltrehalose synthase [Cryobacterium sp. CG_9.6]MDH6237371.1 (1->4)-alpha-D-glucan 1-alpha-D-glucosylmutase [Cryobacterium sp. CG_9.6]
MIVPVSTYRLQIREAFDLTAAAETADYIWRLGADWLYLSPLLKAEAGSDHGYDVVDHSQIDPARGGADGLDRLAAVVAGAGRGLLVDIVPNHMGVATPAQNAWWWDLLGKGKTSRYADAFDVEWQSANGKIRLPVLGDAADELDHLEIVGDELVYSDHRFPLAEGSAADGASVSTVYGRQHYELVNWRRADAELNYRRFFAVNSLAGLRVEVPWVFDESHAEIVRWVRAGLVQGLRVDHPDGLAHPGEYLDRLREATGEAYVLVEKILEGPEQLPANWATSGTSGYDGLADVDRVLVDPRSQAPLDALEARLQGRHDVSWTDLVHENKRAIADGILRSEVLRLTRLVSVSEVAGDVTADAIAELLSCFPVYRSYLPLRGAHVAEAAQLAAGRRPDLSVEINRLVSVFGEAGHPFTVRFQQTSGMVMAKGVEDTAYYRFTRLTSLNEVGADPSEFSISAEEFHHRQQARQAAFPASMTTLSTHDTKRGEDVRARISVLAEVPGEWERALGEFRAAAPLGDAPFENLLWQAIVGAWPLSPERLGAYAEKAAREAGTSTTWTAPNPQFEAALHRLVAATADAPLGDLITAFVARVRAAGWSNSLSAKLVQLMAPGVPDVYQGSELWEMSLVDPDNRRAVDFDLRRGYLDRIESGWLPPVDETGAAKLLVTTRALRLRRDRPELFRRYVPVVALGAAAEHAIAFDRGGAVTVATRLPVALAATNGWGDSTVILEARPYVNVLTGERVSGGAVRLADLLARYPVALLAAERIH